MRLLFLTALTMLAFAANSVLNRIALAGGHIDASDFGIYRLFAGAAILAVLVAVSSRRLPLVAPGRATGVLALLGYIFGFSAAYTSLDAGLGALILFGCVQLTMFGGGLAGGERPPPARWAGAALAMAGLAWLLWPSGSVTVSPWHAAAMALAGLSWGIYSLAGRKAPNALSATAANFILAAPVGLAVGLIWPASSIPASTTGILLALVSGAITSGLGYALWYSLLPRLSASTAAVAQLTVPVIALAGGIVFLGEALTLRFALASLVVLAGVALSALSPRK